jgi:hypothetical protein
VLLVTGGDRCICGRHRAAGAALIEDAILDVAGIAGAIIPRDDGACAKPRHLRIADFRCKHHRLTAYEGAVAIVNAAENVVDVPGQLGPGDREAAIGEWGDRGQNFTVGRRDRDGDLGADPMAGGVEQLATDCAEAVAVILPDDDEAATRQRDQGRSFLVTGCGSVDDLLDSPFARWHDESSLGYVLLQRTEPQSVVKPSQLRCRIE